MREIKPMTVLRHFKGKPYIFLCKAEHSETGEILAIYKANSGDGKVYARPYDMFVSEIDRTKYPHATQKYRFEEIEILPNKETEK